ncbi:ABC transporter substrate-binding protein [Mucilaginibacter lacusdianchii]|uniref:ABC transporter substrate-binding protein n=1 Tax=Mucilaginibacter lacusdianchii TaxID=2684211 RepID=UPI00131BFD64|nr:ABC transporter substrate-binding protein [Mucilaginibacter sp. JXJ CY 39]
MTLVRNHRLPLSGNKQLFWVLGLLIVSACSPKVQPVTKTAPPKAAQPVTTVPQSATTPAKPAGTVSGKTSAIAMLLPFNLDKLNSLKGYNKADLKKANIAIDYYQGFRLALDSLTNLGYNYRLQLFDTKDEPGYTHSLSTNPAIRNSNLIVGPVFPEGIKSFTGRPASVNKPLLSPLSPASPAEFGNPNLITVNPPLEYHAWHAARYISKVLRAKRVFVLKSGFSEDNKYTVPFQKFIDSLGRKKVRVINLNVVRGKLTPLLAQLSKTEENVFMVPSVNQQFLMVTMRSLDTLRKNYPVTVFGHPNWDKFAFLKADLLQRLKVHITAAERVNYRAPATITFIKAYRKHFNSEPSTYAYKGFDDGLYFGQLLAQDNNELNHLDRHNYTALHNGFSFEKKPGLGWVNTHVSILKYANYELRLVE